MILGGKLLLVLCLMLLLPVMLFAAAPQRIVPLSPNVTEILHMLGLDDKVVAVTDHCHIVSLCQNRPSIGTFFSPNVEQIILLNPDLVIGLPSQQSVMSRLKKVLQHTKFLVVQDETTTDVIASVTAIGKSTDREDAARQIINNLQREIAIYKARAQSQKVQKRVLCVVSHTPGSLQQIYAAGKDTFLNELLEIVGAQNALNLSTPRYPLISRETIITLNPDIIIDTAIADNATTETVRLTEKAWQSLPMVAAVKQQHVYIIKEKSFTIPAPQSIVNSLELLNEIASKQRREE